VPGPVGWNGPACSDGPESSTPIAAGISQEGITMTVTTPSTRTVPPFRADHVGSLLRPKKLLTARAEHAEGTITAEQLRAVEDEAIVEVIRTQGDVGLRTATDGEFRRASWHMDFISRRQDPRRSDQRQSNSQDRRVKPGYNSESEGLVEQVGCVCVKVGPVARVGV
jgi:hypothetical protein